MIISKIKIHLSYLTRPAIAILPASALILALLATDVNALSQTKQDLQDVQRNVFVLQSDIADLKAKLNNLPSASDMQQIRQAQADILTQVQDLLREVQVLTGRFEESRFFTDKLLNETSAEVDVLKTKVDTKSQGLSKKDAEELINKVKSIETQMKNMNERLAAIENVVEIPEPDAGDEATTGKSKTPQQMYDEALEVFNKHKYPEARKMMEAFIKAYPEDKLSGNAQFWVGDTYYAEKQYADAILAYEDLLQKYKGHAKIPAALLKQAYAFLEMGDEKAAKGILKELAANYADSEQAKTAQEKLDALEGKKPEPAGPPAKPNETQ